LNNTHDCFLLDGRKARLSLSCEITGQLAKQAFGVAPADYAHEGVDIAGRFGTKTRRWAGAFKVMTPPC
jgi:hypothetical protein